MQPQYLQNANAKLTQLLEKQQGLLQRRAKLLAAPVVRISSLEAVYKALDKTNVSLSKQAVLTQRLAGYQLSTSLRTAGASALIAGAAMSSLLTKTAELFDPAGSMVFQYRMRDLGAVVGSVLSPAFTTLSDGVQAFSRWLYNLDPAAKSTINLVTKLGAGLAIVSVGLGAVAAAFIPMWKIGVAAWTALTAAVIRYNAAAAMSGATPTTRGAVLGKAGGMIGLGVTGGMALHAMGAPGWLTGASVGAGLGGAIGSIVPAIGTAIGAGIGAALGAAVGWLVSRSTGSNDPSGLAPQPTQTLNSGLQAGRMFREASLSMTGKREQEEAQTRAMEALTKQLERLNDHMPNDGGGFFGMFFGTDSPDILPQTRMIRERDAANARGFQ